jgi:hypothetical protein
LGDITKKTSGFKTWIQHSHAEDYLSLSENIGEHLVMMK